MQQIEISNGPIVTYPSNPGIYIQTTEREREPTLSLKRVKEKEGALSLQLQILGGYITPAPPTEGCQPMGVNIAKLLIACGFGTVIKHQDFEERSNYYDAVLSAESCAIAEKKGIHSSKDSPAMHIADLTTASSKKTKDFLPFLQQKRLSVVVEYILSGHWFKLFVPKETCNITFSFSGVRCPGCDEPLSDEAIAFMRRKIMQSDVVIEVKTVDRTGTFLGSMWDSKSNMAVTLLEAGLAELQTSFGTDRILDHLLAQAEQSTKKQKLKKWENFVEGEEISTGPTTDCWGVLLN